jgi:carboxypeptidase T
MRFPPLAGLLLAFPSAAPAQIDFTVFKDTAQLVAGMMQLQARFPTLARVQSIGTSVQGRPIRAVKISDNVATSETSEGAIVLIAAQHCREWLAAETALFVAEKILEAYAGNAEVHADVDRLELFIVPVTNPDGLVQTWLDGVNSNSSEWRKNRRLNPGGSYGVDLNRNWGFQWAAVPAPTDANFSYGDANETSWTYYGTGPFSEPEIQAVRDLIASLPNLKAFEDIHTYSELYLAPWRYTSVPLPPGSQTLEAFANRQVNVTAAVNSHTYTRNLYRSSGGAIDFVWNQRRAMAISPELRPPASATDGGFAPPASEIIPTAQEHLAAVLALMHDAAARHVWIKDYAGDTGDEPSATWAGNHWTHAFWESPDIWTTPTDLVEGATVTLNIHINNDGPGAFHDVVVEAYWNDPRITLEFPGPTSTLIGTQTINTVPPAGKTITMQWTVPLGTNSLGEYHWCVGVVVRHPRDMALTTDPPRSSNVGMKNFTTRAMTAAEAIMAAASNALAVAAELVVYVDTASLPPGWRAEVMAVAPRPATQYTASTLRKARLLGARGILLEPGEVVLVPVHVTPPRGARQGDTAYVRVEAALLPLVAGERVPFGNGFTYRVIVDTTKCRCR